MSSDAVVTTDGGVSLVIVQGPACDDDQVYLIDTTRRRVRVVCRMEDGDTTIFAPVRFIVASIDIVDETMTVRIEPGLSSGDVLNLVFGESSNDNATMLRELTCRLVAIQLHRVARRCLVQLQGRTLRSVSSN